MDELLPQMLAFPPHPPPLKPLSDDKYDEAIRSQVTLLSKCSEKDLLGKTSGGEDTLEVINPALNTVPYLFTLLAKLGESRKKRSDTEVQWLWEKISSFVVSFDPRQIRYLGEQFLKLVEEIRPLGDRIGEILNERGLAIPLLATAIQRVDPEATTLTSTHIALVKVAMATYRYELATPIVEKNILYFPGVLSQPRAKFYCDMSLPAPSYINSQTKLSEKLKTIDVLEYFLLSGMIYIGLQQWKNAMTCLESAVTYPTKDGACSKVMVTAYKKWLLCGILIDGKVPKLPRDTGSNAAKMYHILAKPYDTVATLFETASSSRLKAEIDAGENVWDADLNTGLMLYVLNAFQKFQVRKLGDIYSKISIPEIVNMTTSAETGGRITTEAAEQLIQSMIADGSLHATMSQSPNKPSILTFTPGGHMLSEIEMQRELSATTRNIMKLSQDIKLTDHMLMNEKEYVRYKVKENKHKATNMVHYNENATPINELDWQGDDEDLMTGEY
ncbi:COP9 signalosome complex subunit 3 [Phlyctema vagabunda]|uniref:COP9 signalosome complex subunit 3 n=1 Tax=Phlyctema vagabunda TaxID=108571 RepID=A0ABR4PMS4_9HELO